MIGARTVSLHAPAVADNQRLTGQRIGLEGGEEERRLGDIRDRRELTIDGLLEHDLLDDGLLGDPELARLFGNLPFNEQGSNKAWRNDVGKHAMPGTFLVITLARPMSPCLAATLGSGGLPAIKAELIAPIEIPATQSRGKRASERAW